MIRYSLKRLTLVILTTAILFGLTFNLYSGGFTPSERGAADFRGEAAPPGESLFGNFSTYGLPFDNYEFGATWIMSDPSDQSVRKHQRIHFVGIACNLIFWFIISWALWFAIGRYRQRNETRQP